MGEVIYFKKAKGVIEMSRKYSDIQQFAKAVTFFASQFHGNLYKTKLNKLLFYTQFLLKKRTDTPYFQDVCFCKDYYGPVMENIDAFLNLLVSNEFIQLKHDGYGMTINTEIELDESEYLEYERGVLQEVSDKFIDYSSSEISDYSHKETLWKNTLLKGEIKIERACELRDF